MCILNYALTILQFSLINSLLVLKKNVVIRINARLILGLQIVQIYLALWLQFRVICCHFKLLCIGSCGFFF